MYTILAHGRSRCLCGQNMRETGAPPPADDRRQPRLHILNTPWILVSKPQPCFLEGIVGFAPTKFSEAA